MSEKELLLWTLWGSNDAMLRAEGPREWRFGHTGGLGHVHEGVWGQLVRFRTDTLDGVFDHLAGPDEGSFTARHC